MRHEEGQFNFVHSSVMEWLVANHATEQLKASGGHPEVMGWREMSALMVRFFCELAGAGVASRWAGALLKAATPTSEVAKSNALAVRTQLGGHAQLQLAGQDLRGKDFSGQDLSRANLAGADLTEALLVGTVLTGADLSEATLVRARLDRATLTETALVGADLTEAHVDEEGADLTGADLTGAVLVRTDLTGARLMRADLTKVAADGARLLGADLRGATLTGSRWRRAQLVGACFDDGALAGCDTLGAALPGEAGAVQTAPASLCLAVAFHPDSGLIASGHETSGVRIWDAHRGQLVATLEGHGGGVTSVAWSPDGTRLASGSDDASVRIWDAHRGQLVATLIPLAEGWAVLTPEGGYKLEGTLTGEFWWIVGMCRFEPGELDPYIDSIHRLTADTPLIEIGPPITPPPPVPFPTSTRKRRFLRQ